MSVKLSERMSCLAGMVTAGNRLADVGCDHAYIPIALCQTGKIPSAIAMDVKSGPLERARAHIEECGWDDRIETRLSDGLEKLGEDEADTVMISGMGGLLMRRILTDRVIPASVTELILQPQSEVEEVRRCVRELGFSIVGEDMVLEDGKFYPMMKARRADRMDACGSDQEPRAQEMEDLFGPLLLAERHPVLYKWLKKEMDVTDHILTHLDEEAAGAPDDGHLTSRKRQLEEKRNMLEEALEFYQQ